MSMQDARHQAAREGKTRFYTGTPCRRGHDCERYTSTGGCVECVNPKVFKRRVSGQDVRRVITPIVMLVDRRLNDQQIVELDKYLQSCVGQFEEYLCAQGVINPWCSECHGFGKHITPGVVARCTHCNGSGLEPMPVINLPAQVAP